MSVRKTELCIYYKRDRFCRNGTRCTFAHSQSELSTKDKHENNDETKRKTRICTRWSESGTCFYGDTCWFAHGGEELRPLESTQSKRPVTTISNGTIRSAMVTPAPSPPASVWGTVDRPTTQARENTQMSSTEAPIESITRSLAAMGFSLCDIAAAVRDVEGTVTMDLALDRLVKQSKAELETPPVLVETTDDSQTCCVCFDGVIKTVLIPCGHTILCLVCATKITRKPVKSKCPKCRGEIAQFVETFA
ncbi:hypothetical protein PhCBS80983_g04363 [Powellomyces hirtus]|uniref:RING-type E3 ubiquitin transferase n=1 Tax=Powellomyces hirtus TaxID=109895 RepID=A0A507DXZ4_9FUNG|nr:hypothetical protein PhCBS80983_g04363 [Powellomyces hirtus]